MDGPDPEALAAHHTLGDAALPAPVLALAEGTAPELVWHNELGGLTFRVGERFVKWSPRTAGIDLGRERERLHWLAPRHPAPRVIGFGEDAEAQWLVTVALPGDHTVGDTWRARTNEAIRAMATGLRVLHSLPVDEVPRAWAADDVWFRPPSGSSAAAPPVDEPVVVHGDACAPNTLVAPDGAWVGHVDVGDLGIGDRWADLAIVTMSLDWNVGDGHQDELYAAYGIAPDPVRIDHYRRLWHDAP